MRVRVPLVEQRNASYDILIGTGLLEDLPALLREACPADRYALVTDSHVATLYGDGVLARMRAAGLVTEPFTFPAGEGNKTRETWSALSDRLLAGGYGRDAAVLALGGGVVGDVAGFVAATYLRGIPYVQIPTSLLAMIDSSIGGKTGVDVAAGKNLVGAFHQPRLVIADLATLRTLPDEQLAAGLAEALKHGVVADAAYFDFLDASHAAILAKDAAALERVVRRSMEIKAAVVSQDEREAGQRAILNFGHTVGHAVEATSRYQILHGEAVAIGMAVEARIAVAAGVVASDAAQAIEPRITAVLQRWGLPVKIPDGTRAADLVAVMQRDKKVRAGAIRFALPARIGSMATDEHGQWTIAVAESVVTDVLST